MQPKLTVKEVDFISDLMNLEESVAKKAAAYSKNLTDVSVCEQLRDLSSRCVKRYGELLALLN